MAKPKPLYMLYLAEFTGTALLLAIGLSFVILDWGEGSIVAKWIPDHGARSLVTGFLFGTTGCLVTISPVGKVSGAHINPAVSIAFWLHGKMKTHAMLGYVISQMLGAVLGCLPLLLWGKQGASVSYGNTVPGPAGVLPAFVGEVFTTAALILLLFIFVGNKKIRNYTPYTMPFLYSFMVWAEGSFSGCSTNPARSFGPAVVSGNYTAYWLYCAAPLVGVLLIVGLFKAMNLHHKYHIEAARVGHHNEPAPAAIKTS